MGTTHRENEGLLLQAYRVPQIEHFMMTLPVQNEFYQKTPSKTTKLSVFPPNGKRDHRLTLNKKSQK
jgi:hypothetical protein